MICTQIFDLFPFKKSSINKIQKRRVSVLCSVKFHNKICNTTCNRLLLITAFFSYNYGGKKFGKE